MLRPRRHAADGHRRQSSARPPACAARRWHRARRARRRARVRRHRSGGGGRGRERRDAARAARRLGRARPRSARLRRSSRSAARARCTRARSPRSSRCARCSCRTAQAFCPRSGSSRATSVATACGRTSCRLRDAGELPREGEADLRYAGQSFELTVPLQGGLDDAFHRAHEAVYGYADREREIELVAVRTADVRPAPSFELPPGDPLRRRRARRWSSWTARPAGFPPGGWGLGMVPRWCSRDCEHRAPNHRQRPARDRRGDGRRPDPLRVLREHQGAPRLLDRAVRRARADGRPGGAHPRPPRRDARRGRRGHRAATRRPTTSSSSTTRSPAARTCPTSRSCRAPRSASPPRARTTRTSAAVEPGSMPATSRTLDEEGVVIPPTRLDDATLDALVAQMRNPEERRGDLRAQLAAQRLAARRIDDVCARHGRERVAAAMDELYAYSERLVRAGIAAMPDGRYEAADFLDDGTKIAGRADDRGRLDRPRLRRNRPAAGRQPQLPARGDTLGLLLRRSLSRRARRPRLGRRVRAGDRARAGRLARQRAPARGGRRRQRRDLEPHRRRRLRRVRTGDPRARRRARER